MLKPIVGNDTMEKVLFSLEYFGKTYSTELSKTFNIPVNGIQQQLERLEIGGIAVSTMVGKTRLYQFNPRYPFLKELRILINKAIEFIPEKEIEEKYIKRTRPRMKGKPYERRLEKYRN